MAEYNWWDDRTVEDNDEHFCPILNDICYGDDVNCQKCEVSKVFKTDYKEGILSNIIDNGDKIDGYAYSYKTDSEGVPYINIDSVRCMLSKAKDVQRGHWIKKSEEYYRLWQDSGRSWDDMPYFVTGLKFACSCCFNQYDVNAEGVEEWDFCPKCGADMREPEPIKG